MVAATGDLTTDGTAKFFEAVLRYIRGGPLSGDNPMRTALFGMGAGEGRRVLIPGNHDRYEGAKIGLQTITSRFEDLLGTSRTYPYVRGFRPQAKEKDGLTVLFFVFNSTLTTTEKHHPFPLHKMAAGIITKDELIRLRELVVDVVSKKRVTSLDGESLEFAPEHTIRVALVHHAPVEPKQEPQADERGWALFPGKWLRARSEALARLEGADDFLAGCLRAGAQLVLFGHLHGGYQRGVTWKSDGEMQTPFGPATGLRAFCCPTTLEADSKENGFYVFDCESKESVAMSYYSWVGTDRGAGYFSRDANKSAAFDPSTFSKDEKADAHQVSMPVKIS